MAESMDRIKYLENPTVRSFSKWLEAKLDPPGVFTHQYNLVKARRFWRCSKNDSGLSNRRNPSNERYQLPKFAGRPFPLANNVERLNHLTKKPELGMAIRSFLGADVLKAQASSYLGPYLMKLGIFELVNSHPAMWKLVIDVDEVGAVLKKYHQVESG